MRVMPAASPASIRPSGLLRPLEPSPRAPPRTSTRSDTPVHTPVATTGLRDDDKNDYMTACLPDYLPSFSFTSDRIDPYVAYVRMTTPPHPLGHSPACAPRAGLTQRPGRGPRGLTGRPSGGHL